MLCRLTSASRAANPPRLAGAPRAPPTGPPSLVRMRLVLSFLLAASVALVAASEGKCTPAAEAQVQTAFKSAKDSCSSALAAGECSAECKDSLESTIMVEDNFLRCVRESAGSCFALPFPPTRKEATINVWCTPDLPQSSSMRASWSLT